MVARDAEQNKSKIIELSKSMYVMSPYTSLLVLENDEMYEQYKVDRGRKDHWALYPCPDKIEVVHEPIQGPQPAVPSKPSQPTKPSLEEVLQTLLVRTNDLGADATVQLPTVAFTTDSTTQNVPDGGTVLLGGIRRLREARTERDLPMLSKLPYVNPPFTSGRFDGTTRSLMLMVTPRIIIQEEEEELLGIKIGNSVSMRRFLNPGRADGGTVLADFDSLIDLITSTIEPDSWSDSGGAGAIEPFPTNLSLVISQSQYFHDRRLRSPVYPVGDLVLPYVTQPQSGDVEAVLLTNGLDSDLPILYPNAQVWQELRHRQLHASVELAGNSAPSEERILAAARKENGV